MIENHKVTNNYPINQLIINYLYNFFNRPYNSFLSIFKQLLSNAEWNYLINTRVTLSGIRYAKGNINGTNGVILLPDDWNSANYQLISTNNSSANYTTNTMTLENWMYYLETKGAVFLPEAGYRIGTYLYGGMGYWTSSYSSNERSIVVNFGYYGIIAGVDRYEGYSVRLVQDYNP